MATVVGVVCLGAFAAVVVASVFKLLWDHWHDR